MNPRPTIGILWYSDPAPPEAGTGRLHQVFDALERAGATAQAVVYNDQRVEDVRRQLQELDGVLVWVNRSDGLIPV